MGATERLEDELRTEGSRRVLYTSICSYTRPASGAEDDIELIDALVRGRPETRTFGRIELLDEKVEATSADMKSLALAGMRVEARSYRTVLSGTTDADGRYRTKDVPPGNYVVRVVGPFPKNLEVTREYAQAIDIRGLPASCGGRVDFQAYSSGAVRGRVPDFLGRPLGGNITVSLVAAGLLPPGAPTIKTNRAVPPITVVLSR